VKKLSRTSDLPSYPCSAASRRGENARLLRATAVACVAAAVLTSVAVVNAPPPRGEEGAARGPAAGGRLRTLQELRLAEEQPYRDPASRFRIDFPAGWEVRATGESGAVQATREGATIAVVVHDAATPEMMRRVRDDFDRRGVRLTDPEVLQAVQAELDFGKFTHDQVSDFVERRLRKIQGLAAGSFVEEQGLRELGGRKAGYLRATSRAPGAEGKVVNVLYFTLHRGRYYHVAAGALAAEFDSLAPLLHKTIASFAITER
jgi:hypothetical protein